VSRCWRAFQGREIDDGVAEPDEATLHGAWIDRVERYRFEELVNLPDRVCLRDVRDGLTGPQERADAEDRQGHECDPDAKAEDRHQPRRRRRSQRGADVDPERLGKCDQACADKANDGDDGRARGLNCPSHLVLDLISASRFWRGTTCAPHMRRFGFKPIRASNSYSQRKFGGTTMNDDTLKGQWTQLKGRVREQWGKLTNDDIDQIQGRTEQLVGKIQERYGIARDEARRQVDSWSPRS